MSKSGYDIYIYVDSRVPKGPYASVSHRIVAGGLKLSIKGV